MRLMSSVLVVSLLVSTVSSAGSGQRSYVDSSIDSELKYAQEANAIKELLVQSGIPTNIKVIEKMLKAIDHDIPKYFPNGPYTRNDFIALAWLESAFHQHEIGTHGERGLFQIMPDEFDDYRVKESFFDIDVNTKMGFRVLDDKYKHWNDYKKGIQAYNGVIKLKNGKWSEKYWKQFEKRKVAVDLLLGK